ncbi:hypothetical protein PFICI_02772 [Pestalotiopsis fici W106-1]|uniref:Heterokaryon incompatibility domain-containing protein n=1 Tax=Pestalotiopsis fici (strain W106-1 / CGMCC3.15140) TaxID=1229662 RepID=W3XH58_PESFW|nr:uncharacterized protein PFICI_02772 [Pestalotiopsis fici W106-1]ETS84747.1 hypothetical protein PFICI_02772 [Pestalotiopsis fici W106-1]
MAAVDKAKQFKYATLPPGYIRTLELQPSEHGSTALRCRLIAQRIPDDPYEALSYVWGKPTVYHSSIFCIDGNDETDQGTLRIGANLTKALVAFRLSDRPRRVWVDAICINQEDLSERRAQVRMMGDIFRAARQVLCWLGGFENLHLDEPVSLIAINFLRQFNRDQEGELRKVQNYLHHDVKTREDEVIHMSWLAIKKLFDIEYFHRAWIIQEVGLASRARLSWGKNDIWVDWEEIATFVKFLDDNGASIVTHFDLKSWVCNHICMVWTMKPDGQPLYDFSEVLHWARIHISTDPRDYVYALLGHPSAIVGGDLIIEPRYTVSTKEVYTTLAINTITRTDNLHILAFVDHGEEFETETGTLPTWVPDWHAPNLVAPLRYPTQAAPKTADSIVLDAEANSIRCMGVIVGEIIAISDMITPKELPVTTYDTEVEKSVSFLFDHLYDELVAKTGVTLPTWQDFVFSLSCVLTGAMRLDKGAATGEPMWQQRADCAAYLLKFEEIKTRRNKGGFLQSLSPEDREAFQASASSGSAAIFIQEATWNSMCRNVFRTSKGSFGIGPRIMKTGDLCAIVPGSVYPLILRKWGDQHRLVGPALLYGFMNGEALEGARNGSLEQAEICIV